MKKFNIGTRVKVISPGRTKVNHDGKIGIVESVECKDIVMDEFVYHVRFEDGMVREFKDIFLEKIEMSLFEQVISGAMENYIDEYFSEAALVKTERLIDKLFEWIPRLIQRAISGLRAKDGAHDKMIVLRNENADDAILIGIFENINGTGNILRNIITGKEVVSPIPHSEEYSRTVTTSELHTLNVMIQNVHRHWKNENAKNDSKGNNQKQLNELMTALASVSKSLQRLLKSM